jgi:hypothetical protein
MGIALYPEFEKDIPKYDPSTAMSGKALARAVGGGQGMLELMCRRLGVVPIFDFYSESHEEAFAKIGEPVPPDLPPDEPLKWSDPAEGLRTVGALLACPDGEPVPPDVLEDLDDFRAILLTALEHGTRFRLRIDM